MNSCELVLNRPRADIAIARIDVRFRGKEDITFERFDVTEEGSMEIQLFQESWGKNDNKRNRCVDLYVGADGSVRLSSYDLGPSLKERSDDADL